MTLRLRNTLSRRVEPVEPMDGQVVRMYTCGPTVYRYVHLGNLRTFLMADFIRRALLYHGLRVRHVKNITDVGHMRDEHHDHGGDRILLQADAEGRTAPDLAAGYEAAFHADEALVNILPAHVFPRATEHVADMIALAERLEDLGLAYRSPDGATLYFDTTRFDGYGRLSGNTLDALREGHRGPPEPGKRHAADFALWKQAEPGRELTWQAPRWGVGFPGWHLECSAMARRYLGDAFDIHTGGVDNAFPHHEDEIAQSTPVGGRVPARIWVHGEHLLTAGRKMAKSAGNFQRITDLSAVGIPPLALRYLALTARYGHKLHASEDSLRGAAAALDSLRHRLAALGPPPPAGPWAAPPALTAPAAGDRPTGQTDHALGHGAGVDAPPFPTEDRAHHPQAPLSDGGRELHRRFVEAVDDNLDLPVAVGIVRRMLRSGLADDEARWLVLDADLVLGLDLHLAWAVAVGETQKAERSDEVARLIEARDLARAAKDYATADDLRTRLRELGVKVSDAPSVRD